MVFDNEGVRDKGMLEAIKQAGEGEKGILMLVGASHGISLIPALATSGQFNCSFVRLATKPEYINLATSHSQWLVEKAPRLKLGPENYVTQQIIERSSSKNDQTALLEATLHVVLGPALPPNLERDLDSGSVKNRPQT